MARLAQDINPKSAPRLKQMINELGITQKQLAENADLTQNTISKIIRGNSPLTSFVAGEIVKAYPMYRAEWLEGTSDNPYTEVTGPQFIRSGLKAIQQSRALHHAVMSIVSLYGYSVATVTADIPGAVTSPVPATAKEATDTGTATAGVLKDVVIGYAITKGKKTISLTDDELHQFEDEIAESVELQIRHLFARKHQGKKED